MDAFKIAGPFNIRDTVSAPDFPGLYIWYARFRVEEADWSSACAGSDELARLRLLRAVREHSLKFGRREMAVRAESNFSSTWNGTLHEDYSKRWKVNPSDCEDEPDGFSNRLEAALPSDGMRELFVSLLDCGFPLFCPPLYLGKAATQTLRTRLGQHSVHFLELWERYVADRQFIERLENPKDFAERAIKLGFSPDDLFCLTLAPTAKTTKELQVNEISALIDASEWLLNRWATPILGRQ